MIDDPPTEHERAEAEALARALDGAAESAPHDALEVAALLRYAHGQDQAHEQLLLRARLTAQVAQPVPRRFVFGSRVEPRASTVRRVGAAALALTLAAAALVLAYLPQTTSREAPAAEAPGQAPSSEAPMPVRAPLRRLLDAEAQALAQQDAPLGPLLHASAQQRSQLWNELSRRYGGTR